MTAPIELVFNRRSPAEICRLILLALEREAAEASAEPEKEEANRAIIQGQMQKPPSRGTGGSARVIESTQTPRL